MRRFLWPLVLLVAGCAVPPREAPPPLPAPPPKPAEAQAPFEAWDVVASRLEVRVYRDGPLQGLGHNHVVTSDALRGTVELRDPLERSGFELRLPLESLVVDDPGARSAAGPDFADPVPEKDREATRRNVMGEGVLDAARQDEIRLATEGLSGGPEEWKARVRVALGGDERIVEVPFSMHRQGGRIEARASFSLSHADLGLVSFTAALGALRVRDDIGIELRLEARPAS